MVRFVFVLVASLLLYSTPGWSQQRGPISTQDCPHPHIFTIIEGVGGTYRSPNPARTELLQVHELMQRMHTIVGAPGVLVILLTNCPAFGHEMRTIINPINRDYQVYFSLRHWNEGERTRHNAAATQTCLIRLGRVGDHNRLDEEEDDQQALYMNRCRLRIERGLSPVNDAAIRWLEMLLPENDNGELPTAGTRGRNPLESMNHALAAMGRVPPGSLPPGLRESVTAEIERMRRSLELQ